MSSVDERRILSEIALLLLEELALRGGSAKLKYIRTYKAVEFWAGEPAARLIIERLKEGGFIRIEGERIVLSKQIKPSRGLRGVDKRALALAKALYKRQELSR